ncbi:hypothetical protein KY289_016257 [Solanum tuberosum]|nr:hypothetical protein KY289_016257 [Solanum tuberosum]
MRGPGHNTDNCWTLKGAIEKLIDHGVVIVTDDQNAPNLFRKIGEEDNSIKSSEPVAVFSVEGATLIPKFCVSRGFRKGLKFEQLKGPIFVKPVQQLLEIVEEVDEAGGLTRSGRCYSPEELRKWKMTQNIQVPLKKAVTEEEAEEFLKKIKVPDYSVVEQLKKTRA